MLSGESRGDSNPAQIPNFHLKGEGLPCTGAD